VTTIAFRVLGEPVLDGVPGGGRSRGNSEFGIDRPKMGIDRPTAEPEGNRGLPVRQAARHQTQYFLLASGQPAMPRSRTHRAG
jgi:hypothetical protein